MFQISGITASRSVSSTSTSPQTTRDYASPAWYAAPKDPTWWCWSWQSKCSDVSTDGGDFNIRKQHVPCCAWGIDFHLPHNGQDCVDFHNVIVLIFFDWFHLRGTLTHAEAQSLQKMKLYLNQSKCRNEKTNVFKKKFLTVSTWPCCFQFMVSTKLIYSDVFTENKTNGNTTF